MLPFDLLGFCNDMGQAGLPLTADTVVCRVAVPYQDAFKFFTKDGCRHFGRAMPVDMKVGQFFIAAKLGVMVYTVVAPSGFIGMHDVGNPEFFAHILMDRGPAHRRFPIKSNRRGGNKC